MCTALKAAIYKSRIWSTLMESKSHTKPNQTNPKKWLVRLQKPQTGLDLTLLPVVAKLKALAHLVKANLEAPNLQNGM